MNFWLWFEIVIIFKNETLNLQRIFKSFKFSYLLKNYKGKKGYVIEQLQAFIITNCKKIVRKFICMKKLLLNKWTCSPSLK
jgi:hypothetical protein